MEQIKIWAPSDLSTSRGREHRLLQRMEVFIRELGNSRLYRDFRHLLQVSSISEHLRKVLGGHSKMQMVAYGIGSFELNNHSALQLSLAILMQRDLKWIGFLQVFDPTLCTIECRVLEALGCSVINFNENGMRRALEPTLFYMPYCPFHLFRNLLLVNWNPDLLSNIVIFGNNVLEDLRFIDEFVMEYRNPRITFIKDISWIFFNVELQYKNTLPYDRHFTEKEEIDLQVYSWTKLRLEEKIENFINNLESSQFYQNLQDKLQAPPILQHLDNMMMTSKSKMKIVVCDIGSIESSELSRSRLSLVIFMKRHFKWIGDIQVFERFLSATECQVLKYFGCTILSSDEYRRSWHALKPTIFFMPCLAKALHNKLLEANWKSNLLGNIILFGNSLKNEYGSNIFSHMDFDHSMRYSEAIESFTRDVSIKTLPDGICTRTLFQESSEWEEDFLLSLYNAFGHAINLQFFAHVTEAELQFMNNFLQKGCHVSLFG